MRISARWAWTGLAAATLALAGVASQDQPIEPAQIDEAAMLGAILDRARALEDAGAADAAMVRYAAALALEPRNAEARAALVTLGAAPAAEAPQADPRSLEDVKLRLIEQRSKWEELRAESRESRRVLDDLSRRVRQLQDALDDNGRAEPITDRLERLVADLERRLDRTTSAVERVQRDVERLQREVDRVRRGP